LLSEGQILERARNIVMGLVGNYRIESLDLDGPANDRMAQNGLRNNDALPDRDAA
jgi:hypothetical protein